MTWHQPKRHLNQALGLLSITLRYGGSKPKASFWDAYHPNVVVLEAFWGLHCGSQVLTSSVDTVSRPKGN